MAAKLTVFSFDFMGASSLPRSEIFQAFQDDSFMLVGTLNRTA